MERVWNMRFFAFLALTMLFMSNSHAAKECGAVTHTMGKVEVLRTNTGSDANRVAIRINAPFALRCTDVLVTQAGSRAKLKLSSGMITLSPNSRLSISKVVKGTNDPSLLNLTYGKMRTFFDGKKNEELQKNQGAEQTQFRVRTPSAVVGVRGTDFYVEHDANKELTSQATLKGEVEVEQLKTKARAIVKSGFQVEISSADSSQAPNLTLTDKNKADPEAQREEAPPVISPLIVTPIKEETIADIKHTSPLVKADVEFTSPEAVKILGQPETWIPPKDEIPGDLKDIKNVF